MRYLFLVLLNLYYSGDSAQIPDAIAYHPLVADLQTRFPPPAGYKRVIVAEHSFNAYLRSLPLKPYGSQVHLYDGSLKRNTRAYCAVVDLDIGKKDLQQCADAVMRLRGEYLFHTQQWRELGFLFTKDNRMHYFCDESGDRSYASFRKWMDHVFAFANTRSLFRQLIAKPITGLEAGDVLIQTGDPYGHAVIVLDVAVQPATGKKIFLLAQSYMPAQDIQVLCNPATGNRSPWYELNKDKQDISTPEWDFTINDLRSFK